MADRPAANRSSSAAGPGQVEAIRRAAADDLGKAISMAVAARSKGLSDPLVHYLAALRLKQDGRLEDAIAELGRGLELDPHDVRLTCEVGFCLMDLGRPREAARVFEAALKIDPGSADASFGYGWAAEHVGALDVAESNFKRALALNPEHAHALTGLAGLAVRRREWETARSYAEQALAIDPKQTDALMHLARVEMGLANHDAAEARLQEVLRLPHLGPRARANVHILIGDARDGAGRYRDAFAAYKEGKSDLRRQFSHLYDKPGGPAAITAVEEILTEYQENPDAWSARPAAPPEGGERGHAFLVGFPRSGTTLLENVLATHPDVVSLEERPVLIDAETEFLTRPGGIRRVGAAPSEALRPFRQAYWARVREFGAEPAGKVFIDKHPLSTFRLPLISKVFPGARIIFAIRDPRDVVLSCFRRSFNMNAAIYEFHSIERAARLYDAVMRAGEIYLRELPLDVHRLRYEDLVADFEATCGALCDFLGVDRTDRLKDFARTARTTRISTPSSAQVVRGLYSEGVGQWRNYAFALEPALPVLQPWIDKFGYASTGGDGAS